ncbi:unnamed protein product [Rotaria magnacalcarata]|uniref:Uncharacterized protein n=3 Tax=Rotaria magnacalcarata TaxID=392030 RepID=A0A818ZJ14_9BILA|nr:unnamed protein product [Rotaria magnacalcarata]CAF3772727.1 unnamed protein product [Rotaria magnacalcarata]
MITTTKTPLISVDSFPISDPIRIEKPLRSSLSTIPTDLPERLSTPALHKRSQQKRVRFASKLEFLEEELFTSSREISPSPVLKPNKRVIDPWRQHGPLYGAYVEYLENQGKVTSSEIEFRQIPPPAPPAPPEPGAQPPTYRHTFVIQSKSPELVIDSITISSPQSHLPRIAQRNKKPTRQPIQVIDSYMRQQLQLSTPPNIVYGRKIANSSIQKYPDPSAQPTLKRTIISMPSVNGIQANNKTAAHENVFRSKFANDYGSTRRMTRNLPKPLSDTKNEIYHFAEQSILSNYPIKPATPGNSLRRHDKSNIKAPHFFENHANDHLLQPIIHSTH